MQKLNKVKLLVAVVFLNLVLTAVLAIISTHNRIHSQHTLNNIGQATAYVCNTTNILDVIVRQAQEQLQTNFKLGEYTRLEKAGVLTKHDVALARKDLILYTQFDKQLQQNAECQFTITK